MLASSKMRMGVRFVAGLQGLLLSAGSSTYAIPLGDPLKALSRLQSNAYAAEDPAQQREIDAAIEKGAQLYREGKWAEAIEIWEEVLKKDPKNETAQRYIERAKKKISAKEIAPVPAAKAAEEKAAPTVASPAPTAVAEEAISELLKKGVDLYRDGKYTEAIQAWNQVLAKDPNNERAKRYVERALKKQAEVTAPPATPPIDETKALMEEAQKLYREEKIAEAIEIWKKVVALDPMNLAAKRNLERAQEKLAAAEKKPAPPAPPAVEPSGPSVAAPEKKAEAKIPVPIPVPAPPKPTPIVLLPSPAPQGEMRDYGTLSLQQCILLALANYGPAKVSREEIKLAKMRLIEARRAFYPSANLKNGITEGVSTDEAFEGLEFTAEFQLPIMSGGRIKNSIRQAEANLAVAIKNYEKLRADYVAEVEQAYYAFSNAKKYYRDRQDLLKEGNRALDITRKQFDLGLARQLDLLNVESQYNEVEFQITSAEKDLQLAYLTLKQLMNLKDNEIFDTDELGSYTVISVDYETIVKLALERRPDIRLAELQVLFNKYAVKVAEARNKFKIDMNASVGLNDQFFVESESLELETEFFVGIKATKPLGMHVIENNFIIQDKVPAAGQTTSSAFGSNTVSIGLFNNVAKTAITEAKIAYYRAKDEYEKGKKTTRFEIQQNFFEYQKGLAQLEGAITRLKLGEVEVKILKAQADLNQAQLIDVLRAQVRQYDAKANYGQSVTSYYTAMANLNKAVGIIGYFNPVTGEVSEAFNRQLSKPINKPRFRFFTQLTKDRPEEDILTFPPEKVTAATLLEKERRKTKAFERNFSPIVDAVPGAPLIFTPNETRIHYLNSIQLPPEKPLQPLKPWQFLRFPVLGFFEYEKVVDDLEAYSPTKPKEAPPAKPKKKKAAAPKPPQKQAQTNEPAETPPLPPSIISALKIQEDKDFVRVILEADKGLSLAAYELEQPDRLLIVLDNPVTMEPDFSVPNIENTLIRDIRFNTDPDQNINGLIIDLARKVPYRVERKKNLVTILLEKS